LKYQKDTRWIL